MKKMLVFVIAFVIGATVAVAMASTVNRHTIYVDQYTFNHGVIITIDWNVYTVDYYDCHREYYGCVNYGTRHEFVYMTKENWYQTLRNYAENFEDFLCRKQEWRW